MKISIELGGREFKSQPGNLFSFFSTKVITFKTCNIFELIWYSEWPLTGQAKSANCLVRPGQLAGNSEKASGI